MTILFSNNETTTIAGGITSIATTVNLQAGSGAGFPHPIHVDDFFIATFTDQVTGLINEIVHVTNITGDVATIVRGQEGTTPIAWNSGDIFSNLHTAGAMAAMIQQNQIVSTLTFFVNASTGNDNNSGLTITDPFATLQGAVNAIILRYVSIGLANIVLATGNYNGVTVPGSGISNWNFIGNTGNPALVVVSATVPATNFGRGFIVRGNNVQVSGITFATYYENLLYINASGDVITCHLTGPTSGLVAAISSTSGGLVGVSGTSTYSGGGAAVVSATNGGSLNLGYNDAAITNPLTLTITGNPVLLYGTVFASLGVIDAFTGVLTITGTTQGPKFTVNFNGVVYTAGAGINYFPGTLAGIQNAGGQYG